MSQSTDADEPADKLLCIACIGDGYLRRQVSEADQVATCSYCGAQKPTVSIGDLAEKCHLVFETFFERTASEPDGNEAIARNDPEGSYGWERAGDPTQDLIAEFAGVDEEPANDIRSVMEDENNSFNDWNEEQEYGDEASYINKTIFAENFHFQWARFERSLRNEARLFNKGARDLFADIFEGIADHPTRGGATIIVDAGPGNGVTELYRARVFAPGHPIEEALKQPDRNFGPPPPSAAKPGRMNARGISVFYGATDPKVALAEVRPPVGSRVVIARFEIIRPLRLLSIKALEAIYARGSLFDPDHLHREERAKFLGRISNLIESPVMPSDDGFDYIVTQAIAEYLANEVGIELDGLLFPSVQTADSSLNVVLFHKSSKVQPWVPLGEIRADSSTLTSDGLEEEYYVREVAEPGATRAPKKQPPWSHRFTPLAEQDERPDTLAVDIQSLHIHEVQAVSFRTLDRHVTWHTVEQKPGKF
jgi:hypothetical protein